MPCDPTNLNVKLEFQKMVDNGTYNIGETIVPQTFQRLIVMENSETEMENFEISGRKIPISEIQSKLYTAKKDCYCLFSMGEIEMMDKWSLLKELERIDEMTDSNFNEDIEVLREKIKCLNSNRYIQFWHDGSSISNHSHLLMAVNCIYVTALHVTNEE